MSRQYNFVCLDTLGTSVFEKPIDLITISCPDNLNLRKDVIIEDADTNEEIRKIKVGTLYPFKN